MGLLKAIRDFDLSMDVELSTYAVPRIAGEMRRFLRDDGPVKVSRVVKERAAQLRQVQARLEGQTGQSPRLSDLCRETGLSSDEVMEAISAPREADSLDAALPGQERTLGEVLPAGGEQRLLEGIALREALCRLAADAPLRRALGENLRRHARENFSLEAMGQRQREIYSAVLESV